MSVHTTAEAIATFGRAATRHRIATGMWQQPHRGVVVTHNGPLTPEQEQLAVLAAAPRRAALAGLTSLHLDGLDGFATDLTHLALPNGARRPKLDGVATHQSIHLGPDVHPWRTPRRTTPGRSVIDAASWCGNDRLARAIVIAALQQGITCTRDIREALQRRPTQLRRGLVVESVLDAAGGIQSLPERDFDQLRLTAGLPTPSRQHRTRGTDGRFFLDVHIEELDLSIEIHGIPHLAVQQWDRDLLRANEIVIAGRRLLIFSSYAVRHEQAAVLDQLRRAAARLGAPSPGGRAA